MTSDPADLSEWRFPNQATPLGSATYYAVRFSPPAQRERNAKLIAWYRLIESIAEQPRDPGVARLKLDWWREELLRLPDGEPRHPLARALRDSAMDSAARSAMRALIDAAEHRICTPPPTDDRGFGDDCRAGFGGFFVLLATLEPSGNCDLRLSRETGAYCAAVERIRGLAFAPQRVPGWLDPQALRTMDRTQRHERCEALLAQFDCEANERYPTVPILGRKLHALAGALQDKMRATGYAVSDRVIDRAPLAHLWTAWRCP